MVQYAIRADVENLKVRVAKLEAKEEGNFIFNFEEFLENFKEGKAGPHDLDFMAKEVPIKDIKPSQTREDYINETSKGYARGYILENIGTPQERRLDVGPLKNPNQLPAIIVDKNNKVIDGNHRLVAAEIAKLEKVKVVTEDQLKEFYNKQNNILD